MTHDEHSNFLLSVASVQGAWSSEEENQLLYAMEGLAREGKSDMSARGFWVSVSKAMGAIRTPKQCQSKWYVLGSSLTIMISMTLHRSETLQAKVQNGGRIRRWVDSDSYILISKYIFCALSSLGRLMTQCIGSLPSTLTTKVTLFGNCSVILRGTCGVVIISDKNGRC